MNSDLEKTYRIAAKVVRWVIEDEEVTEGEVEEALYPKGMEDLSTHLEVLAEAAARALAEIVHRMDDKDSLAIRAARLCHEGTVPRGKGVCGQYDMFKELDATPSIWGREIAGWKLPDGSALYWSPDKKSWIPTENLGV